MVSSDLCITYSGGFCCISHRIIMPEVFQLTQLL